MKKSLGLFLALGLSLFVVGCESQGGNMVDPNSGSGEAVELNITYQPSLGYAPLVVMKEKNLIEEAYDGDITVNWVELKSGAATNEALAAGDIDVGTMGVPVAVSGIMAGSQYKIAAGLSGQPYSVLTSSDDINSLSDILNSGEQIAILNINSQPHILLAMAAKAELGDAHALDGNLTTLANADGYAAMLSGAVKCHMVTAPFNFMELQSEDADIHELPIGTDVWPAENTAQVFVVTESYKEAHPDVYAALLTAIDNADEFINSNPEETAEMLSSDYDASPEDIVKWLQDPRSNYESSIHGVGRMVDFMASEGFIEAAPESFEDLVYDNVIGD